MKRIQFVLIFLLLLSCLNCKQKPVINNDCGNEKAFVSLDAYINIQDTEPSEIPFFPTDKLLKPIDFDSLKSFDQVDSLKSFYYKEESYCIIPLKFVFNADTLLLPAFYFACNYCPDRSSRIINVSITDKNVNFDFGNSKIDITDNKLKDSLTLVFTKVFRKYFEEQFEISEKVKDKVKAKEFAISIHPKYPFVFNISVQNDSLIPKLRTPIEIILSAYLPTLKDCIKTYYKKEICELTPFELKLFSSNLFLIIDIDRISK